MTTTTFDEMNYGLWLGAIFATFGFVRLLISCRVFMQASKLDSTGEKKIESKSSQCK